MSESYFGKGRITKTAWPHRNEPEEGPGPIVSDKPENGAQQENATPTWLSDWGYRPRGKGVEKKSAETTITKTK
jgi:hypothetical protein